MYHQLYTLRYYATFKDIHRQVYIYIYILTTIHRNCSVWFGQIRNTLIFHEPADSYFWVAHTHTHTHTHTSHTHKTADNFSQTEILAKYVSSTVHAEYAIQGWHPLSQKKYNPGKKLSRSRHLYPALPKNRVEALDSTWTHKSFVFQRVEQLSCVCLYKRGH